MKTIKALTAVLLSLLLTISYANPAAPTRTLVNATDCLTSASGTNPRLYPWVQYTIYSFVKVDNKRAYSGISIAPGQTKAVQLVYDDNNQLYFDIGFSADPKVTPYINYYSPGSTGPAYIVRTEENNSVTCSNNPAYPYVPCIGIWGSDPCAALRK